MSNPVTSTLGSTLAQAVYDTVCYVLLEDGGLTLQATPQQFLDLLQIVLLDWFQKTELPVAVYTQEGMFSVAQYPVPDEITRPVLVLYDGLLLRRTNQEGMDTGRGNWEDRIGEPQVWHEDGLPAKTIEIADAPQFQGADMDPTFGDFFAGNGQISIVGPERPTGITLALNSALSLVPDSFTYYLGYGVLAKLFSTEGELKDESRAAYCAARYQEGVMLAQAISGNDLEEESPDA